MTALESGPPALVTMPDRVARFDWSQTPLGPIAAWPRSLATAVGICMNSRFPMFVWWGKELINIYNDAYAPILGARHPSALGAPAQHIWSEIWDVVGRQAEAVMERGEATWNERALLVMERKGYTEETWFTWSYSPIPDEDGGIGGLFCVCTEETSRVHAERERDRLLEEVRKHDREFRDTADVAPAMLWVTGPEGDRTYLSRGWYEFTGLPDGAGHGTGWTDAIHPDDRAAAAAAFDVANAARQDYVADFRLRRADGAYRWVIVAARPRFVDGEFRGFVGSVIDVHDRKLGEAALVTLAERHGEQLRRYDRMLSSITDFAYTADRDGRFTFANKPLLDLWGLTLHEAVGKTFLELDYPPELAAVLHRQFLEVIATGVPVVDETPYTSASGHPGYYQYIFAPVFAEDGTVEAVAGTTRDITEHKRAEATLRAAEARSRTILESITDGYFALDRAWRFTYVNPQAERILEHRAADMVGRLIWDAFPGLVGSEFEQAYRRSVDDRVVTSSTTYYPDHRRWYESHAYPVPDGLSVYFRDITEQKRAAEALREGATRLEFGLASARVGEWDLDLSTDTSRRSLRHDECFGYAEPVAEWGLATLLAHVHPDDRAAVRATFEAGVTSGATWQLDCRVVWPDASIHWIAMHGSLYRSAGDTGAAPRMLGIVFDITERKRVEHEVRELAIERESLLEAERSARTEAVRASAMKDEFLATLSHELRTPLHAILGWSQLLKDAGTEADITKGLTVIERNARAQAQIIDDLLDMSRIISGKVQLDVQRLELATVVATAIETARPAADARGVRLLSALDPLRDATVIGDPTRLQQVLSNLLSNAIKFTARGGSVQVVLAHEAADLALSVIDSGEGIAPEFLPFVFDRFRQADPSTTRRHGGLGLGLSIVKQLTELHGGTIAVHSDGVGQGTRFTMTLPRAANLAPAEAGRTGRGASGAAARPLAPALSPALDGVRVLVVDDEPDARALVKRLLEQCRAAVTSADSAGEAVRLLEAGSYDVLVSDIGMPGEDGYSLIRRVRALGKARGGDVPAIALTAYARTEDRVKAIAAGFQMHVAKPVEPLELVTMVAGAAGKIGAPAREH